MVRQASLAINALRIAHMSGLQIALKTVRGGGHRHQRNVMAHQTIGQTIRALLLTIVLQAPQVGFPIVVGQKDSFPAIPALGEMMRHLGKDGSSEARQRRNLS